MSSKIFKLVFLALTILIVNEAWARPGGRQGILELSAFNNRKVKLTSANHDFICGEIVESGERVCAPSLPSLTGTVGPLKSIYNLGTAVCGEDEAGLTCWAREKNFSVADLPALRGTSPTYVKGKDTICKKSMLQSRAGEKRTLLTCLADSMEIVGSGTVPFDIEQPTGPAPQYQFIFRETVDVAVSRFRICALEKQDSGEVELVCIQSRSSNELNIPVQSVPQAKRVYANPYFVCALGDRSMKCFDKKGLMDFLKPYPTPREILGWKSFDINEYGYCMTFADGSVHCNATVASSNPSVKPDARLTQSPPSRPVAEVQLGEYFGCARFEDGGVECWGDSHNEAIRVPKLSSPVAEISVGTASACARYTNQGYQCWGTLINQGQALSKGSPVHVSMGGATSLCAWNDSQVMCDLGWSGANSKINLTLLPNQKIESLFVDPINGGGACGVLRDRETREQKPVCWGENAQKNFRPHFDDIISIIPSGKNGVVADRNFGLFGFGESFSSLDLPSVLRDLKRVAIVNEMIFVLDRFGLNCYGNCKGPLIEQVPGDLVIPGKLEDVWIGKEHACGIVGQDVVCWGSNGRHDLLRGPGKMQSPVSLIGGGEFTCASDQRGVFCWGNVPEAYEGGQ